MPECEKWKGNADCCNEVTTKVICPSVCLEAALKGKCLPECEKFKGKERESQVQVKFKKNQNRGRNFVLIMLGLNQ